MKKEYFTIILAILGLTLSQKRVSCAEPSTERIVQIARHNITEQQQKNLFITAKKHKTKIFSKDANNLAWNLFIDLCFHTEQEDEKTIPDLVWNYSINRTITEYNKIKPKNKTKITEFSKKYFKKSKPDITRHNPIITRYNPNYKEMLTGVRRIWKALIKNPNKNRMKSIIPQRRNIVVPGGRFQEAYYWDFFWMEKGLIISKDEKTVKNMLDNFADQINVFGFIPNGTRWYYTNRSQPPYFTQMLFESLDEFKKIREIVRTGGGSHKVKSTPGIENISKKIDKLGIKDNLKKLRKLRKLTGSAVISKGIKDITQDTLDIEGNKDIPLNNEDITENTLKSENFYENNLQKTVITENTEDNPQKPVIIQQPLIRTYYSEALNNIDVNISNYNLNAADKEFIFWIKNRTVKVKDNLGKSHILFRYSPDTDSPRPEMFISDLISNENYKLMGNGTYYKHITAATESGWDFSKRWRNFDEKSKMYGFLNTKNIIPVDLNSIFVKNARLLHLAYKKKGTYNKKKAEFYQAQANQLANSIDTLMWDENSSRWRDIILVKKKDGYFSEKKKDKAFYHSDLHPLYMDIVNDPHNNILNANKKYIWTHNNRLPCTSTNKSEITRDNPIKPDQNLSIKCTLEDAVYNEHIKNDQWDGDNVWPPLVQLTVEYLIRSGNISLAKEVSVSYALEMHKYYSVHNSLPEKIEYVKNSGEYSVQDGFGWSIGVLQWMDYVFGEELGKEVDKRIHENAGGSRD
ncbi:alpha,alpha-trehalase [Nematocida ausubeli]|nr:alpha,alpha-trehalase [Nematocida ausubeli]